MGRERGGVGEGLDMSREFFNSIIAQRASNVQSTCVYPFRVRSPLPQERSRLGLSDPPGGQPNTMGTTYDAAVRDAVRQRMSPANRESIPDIAWDTGIALKTLYSWRSQWQNQWSAGACDLPGARAVVTGRQAGDSDPDGWVERGRTGKFLP